MPRHQRNGQAGPHLVPPVASRFLLLMRLPLGDTLFVTPTIHALRQRYPNALITALASATNAPLLRHNPDLDDTVVLPFRADWRGGGALPATLRLLLHRRYDVALCFGTPALGWLPYAAGIARREYLDYPPLWWLLPRDFSAWNRRHAVELYATAARRLDIPPLERRMHVQVTAAERAAARGLLHQLRLARAPVRVAIHPGSGAAPDQKRWPLCRFVAVAQTLVEQADARIIVVGGASERVLGAQLARDIGGGAVSLAGRLDLRQSLALFEACDLFIGNDSGPLHLATAVGTPVVGIYGATDPVVFGPWTAPEQAAIVRPKGAEAAIHFVGGATIWDQIGGTRQTLSALATLPSDRVSSVALRLLAGRIPVPVLEAGGAGG